jgi:hypothetical protein
VLAGLLRAAAAAATGVLALAAVVALPAVAVAMWLVLGAVIGALAGVWTWLTTDGARRPVDVGMRIGLGASAGGLALAGLMVLLDGMAVLVVPAVVAIVVLAHRPSGVRRGRCGGTAA